MLQSFYVQATPDVFFFFFPIFTLNVPYVNKILHEGEEQFHSSEIRTVFDVFYSESYYFYIAQE